MKLRYKVLAGIMLIWLAYVMIIYAGSREFLIKHFLTLESERVNRDLDRVDQALAQNQSSLYTFTSDWAHWNDLYDYMQGKNSQFFSKNLNITALVNSSINYISYWDAQGKLIISKEVDIERGQFVNTPKGLIKYIHPGSPLLNLDIRNDIKGYISLPDGIMMISSVAVTDGSITKNALGTLLTGRFISEKIIQNIENVTKLNLNLILEENTLNDTALKNIFNEISKNKSGHLIRYIDDKNLAAYSIIHDLNNRPIGMIQITSARPVYESGKRVINYYLASFIMLGVLFMFLFIWLLRVLIVKRLENLNADLDRISKDNQFSGFVDQSGTDELAKVSKTINDMMQIIQASHTELEKRVEARTLELQFTNKVLEKEISERKTIENELIINKEHLINLAHFDSLTSLPNRIYFNEMLDKILVSTTNQNKKLAVMFIDLDRFKNINDALGHHMGDLVLKEISQRISGVLRRNDVLARLGGDEFILLLNDIDSVDFINSFAERILNTILKTIIIDDHEFFLSASIGICIFPDDGSSLEDLQRNADMAMYKSKHSGGNLYQYYTKQMNDDANKHIQLEASLRKAIANNEFILYYQPKYYTVTGEIAGVEALIRWNHPERGLLSPLKFIPHAEESGLIMQIGEWVINEACRACKSWQTQGYKPVTVAVNISPKQFKHQDIAQLTANVLAQTQLDARYLELEITESAMMEDVETTTLKLKSIHDMGVKIAIDDFGTGYSSIGYLKQFPVSTIKIDRRFVKGIPNNQDDSAITSAIIMLSHNMDMTVVAEGVETREQIKWLSAHHCDIVQGYFLNRPLSESNLLSELGKKEEKQPEKSEEELIA